jgi:uncharacterized linocin/CFP29 family protein
MYDYLMREAAPFGPEVWAKIDEMAVNIVKKTLVGRRFVEIVGPLGWGVETAPKQGFGTENGAHVATAAQYVPLQEIGQDFLLRAKHLVMADQTPFGLDLGAVAIAAIELAKAEDRLVIGGLAAEASCTGALGDWTESGEPLQAVANATAELLKGGNAGPYALVVGSATYAKLAGLMRGHGRELEMVEKLVKGGIFQYNDDKVLVNQAMVVSLGAWNFDLVIGQDVVTAYLANEGLDQLFRIFETLVLRVKRPGAVCVLS